MNHSSKSYIDPGQLNQFSDDKSTCSFSKHGYPPELPFQPQLPPLKPLGYTDDKGYQRPKNGVNKCNILDNFTDHSYGEGSGRDQYVTLPVDFHYQNSYPTTEDRNDSIQILRVGGSKKIQDRNITFEQEDPMPIGPRRRSSSRSSSKLTSEDSGLDKRERNRKAASKCRKKQKLANNELQEMARVMDKHHDYLIAHKASLESEMIGLKNELLLHGSCGCQHISEYLMHAAKKFANGREGEVHDSKELAPYYEHCIP
ncbi:hypothetical protein F4804DRAFT_348745 [Jackrogersella minutella]|nr:hypothetical protein F4804DRAFT_348745 [Jackrogersella minutella]